MDCKNCGKDLPAEAHYCPACGQSVKDTARPWPQFVRETLDELFDFDGRMLSSLRLLFTRPGFLSREYIDGRRQMYTPPIRMYLVISVLFFLVLPMILPDSPVEATGHNVSVDLYSKGMFLMLPLFALLLKGFYPSSYYLAHLVFTVHLFSAMFIGFALLLSVETLADRYLLVALAQIAILLYMLAYIVISSHTLYGESWARAALKSLAILLVFVPILTAAIELVSHQNLI